jgi:nucleotide-binding universal stress UspA family protein
MTSIKTIMVALGFSEYAKGIFTYAAGLAKSLDADILVVSVINQRDVNAVQTISAMGYDVDGGHYVEGIRSERKGLLVQYQEETDYPKERVKTIFRMGNPLDELLRVALKEAVDMIVMGVKGRTDLESVFVGSLAEKMFRRSPITIVSYRDPVNAARLKKRINLIPE